MNERRAIRESPLRAWSSGPMWASAPTNASALRGMAVRAAFQAPVEPQLLSSLGGSCAAGAAALFASSARPNRALSAYRFCGPPEPHRRGAPGSRAEALVVSSRGSLQAKNPAAGGRASKKETDCRVGPAGPPRNDTPPYPPKRTAAGALGPARQGQLQILRIGRCCIGSTCLFLYALFVMFIFPITPISV